MLNNEEIHLSFLLSGICGVVPSSNYKLQSYLKAHLSNLADKYNINLPRDFKNRNKTCPHCYTFWSSETTSFKLLPTKKCRFRQAEKEKKLNEKGQIKQSRNTLVLKCKVCTNKSLFSLVKKERVQEVKQEVILTKKKKKKKKDKTCGLNINLKNIRNTTSKVSKKEKSQKKTNQNNNSNSVVKNPLSNTSESTKNKPNPNTINNKDKKLLRNPFAAHPKGKSSKKKDRKLQSLKKAISVNKSSNSAQETLKSFLKLV